MVPSETPVATVFNRSLRYGDGLFETMYWDGIRIRNEGFHMDRLFPGLEFLKFDLSDGFDRFYVLEEIKKICLLNAMSHPARIRLNVYREDGSQLGPKSDKPVFIIESANILSHNDGPVRLTIYHEEKKFAGKLSNLKTNNYLLSILAYQYACSAGFDDGLILNHRGDVCEAVSSNLFMIQKGIIYTPSLSEGSVAGTKRREVIETLPDLGFQVEETNITLSKLWEMDEVFLTNAIRGVRPVSEIDGQNYQIELGQIIKRILDSKL